MRIMGYFTRPDRAADRDDADAGGGETSYWVVSHDGRPGPFATAVRDILTSYGYRVEPAVAIDPATSVTAQAATVRQSAGRPVVLLPGVPGLRADPGRPGGAEYRGIITRHGVEWRQHDGPDEIPLGGRAGGDDPHTGGDRGQGDAAAQGARKSVLLETDIPPHLANSGPPSPSPSGLSATLRDGTPATPGEFRRRYQALLELGDRLRAGSRKFLILYREGEAEGWTVERLDRWEAIDGKFVALVQEGWIVWSGAAFCFDCAPEAFKRNVVAKLGFIGSREQGWHELGIKTFLRHPEVAEVQPLRRELREKIGARL
jgi:hypothetical protein